MCNLVEATLVSKLVDQVTEPTVLIALFIVGFLGRHRPDEKSGIWVKYPEWFENCFYLVSVV